MSPARALGSSVVQRPSDGRPLQRQSAQPPPGSVNELRTSLYSSNEGLNSEEWSDARRKSKDSTSSSPERPHLGRRHQAKADMLRRSREKLEDSQEAIVTLSYGSLENTSRYISKDVRHQHTRSLGGGAPSSSASEASPSLSSDSTTPALALASPEWPHVSSSSLSSEASPTSPSRHRTSFPWGFPQSIPVEHHQTAPIAESASATATTSASRASDLKSRKRRSQQFDVAAPIIVPDGERSLLRLSEMNIHVDVDDGDGDGDKTTTTTPIKSRIKKPPPVSDTLAMKRSLFHPDLRIVEDAAGDGSRRICDRPSAGAPTQHPDCKRNTTDPVDMKLAIERARSFRDDTGDTIPQRRPIKRSQTEP